MTTGAEMPNLILISDIELSGERMNHGKAFEQFQFLCVVFFCFVLACPVLVCLLLLQDGLAMRFED